MAERPISLAKARKARAKAAARRQADANSAAFGRTKAQKEAARARTDAETRRLEGHRRDDGEAEE